MKKNTPTAKQGPVNDLGFGTTNSGGNRNMNKDGSFNVERTGTSRFRTYEIYHQLIAMSWGKFIFLLLMSYFVTNLFFAFIYYAIGVEHLSGISGDMDQLHKFAEAFFFSSQTLTTVGFGRIAPQGIPASTIAAIESMAGVLVFAIATGLLYGRFSRPQAKLIFSHNALVAPYKGNGHGLMFRIANLRRNQLIEVEVEVNIGFTEPGAKNRSFLKLPLERNKIALFPTSWTIVHPIDEESPLYNRSENELATMNLEIFVILKAFDDTFSQTVYSRSSYRADEIVFGAKFLPMFHQQENGTTLLDLSLIDAMEKAELPVMTAQIAE
jgi:inward rectifier potassium channel